MLLCHDPPAPAAYILIEENLSSTDESFFVGVSPQCPDMIRIVSANSSHPGHPAQTVGSPLRPTGFLPGSPVLRLPLSPATGVRCSPLFTEIRTQALPLREVTTGPPSPRIPATEPQVTSPIRELRLLAIKARPPPWAFTPHTRYMDLMKAAPVPCGRW